MSQTLQNSKANPSARETEGGSPLHKYSTYSAVNSVGASQVARNYICTSNSIKANIHDRRAEANQSPLNPSID